MKTIRYISLLYLSIAYSFTFAQSEFTITGYLMDNQSPLEFATVTLLNTYDASFVTGVSTDEQGYFSLSFLRGKYTLKATFLGYASKEILIDATNTDAFESDLGIIQMSSSGVQLTEVEVRGKRSRLIMEDGKKVFYVGSDLATLGGAASDLLGYVPSISVDIEGKIKLRGKSPTIQVNGRNSNLSREEVLRMLPGHLIERVEIITNPSASEGAEGNIINIIMKKDKAKGVNGGLSFTGGLPASGQASINLARNKEPWYIYGLYGLNRIQERGFSNRSIRDNSKLQEENSKTQNLGWANLGELGFEYEPNKKTVLEGATSFGYTRDNQNYSGDRTINDLLLNALENRLRDRNSTEWEWNFEQDLEFERALNLEDQEIKFELEVELNEAENQEQVDEIVDRAGDIQEEGGFSLEQKTDLQLETGVQYNHPLWEDAIITTGYELDYRRTKEDETLQNFANSGNLISQLDNDVVFQQNVQSGFLEYTHEIDGLFYRIGVRAEHTQLDISSSIAEQSVSRKYLGFFPNFLLQYEIEDDHSILFGYERRVRRPRLRHLNPFITSLDAQRVRRGNPDLNPEFSHEIELEYLKEMENTTFTATAYAYYENGTVQYITTVNDGIAITAPLNLGNSSTYGLDLYYGGEFTKWLNTDITLDIFHNTTNETEDTQLVANQFISFRSAIRNIIDIDPFKFELTWNFQGPRQFTYQERIKSIHYLNFGASHNILKNKGKLILSVSDIFNTRIQRYDLSDIGFVAEGEVQRNGRQFYLTMLYRINKRDRKSARKLRNNLKKKATRDADIF